MHVVLPVYHEGDHCHEVVHRVVRFAAENPAYSFLFVDDGSRDHTPRAIRQALRHEAAASEEAVSRVHVLRHRFNGGKGWAVSRGVRATRGADDDLLIFTDGDLAYSLDHLPRIAAALEEADVAIGSRRDAGGAVGAHTLRRWMGWTFNRVARGVLGASYRDTQAGLKGFRLSAARRIFSCLRDSGFSFDVELLAIAGQLGYTVAEVPAQVASFHRHKSSTVSVVRDPLRMLRSLASVRANMLRGTYSKMDAGQRPMLAMSFDAEEFDIPLEFGGEVDPVTQMAVAAEGMHRALDVLEESGARATFFCTAAYARAHPEQIRRAVESGHEIASHGLRHSSFAPGDLAESRRVLREISGQEIRGFRRARFAATDPRAMLDAGYTYDSSINPIWLPGRYNALGESRRPFFDRSAPALLRIPVSATPILRVPLFWLAFKNMPGFLYRRSLARCLDADGLASLVFHPWELCELRDFGLPRIVRRIDGEPMQARLVHMLRWAARRARFVTYSEVEDTFRASASSDRGNLARSPSSVTAAGVP